MGRGVAAGVRCPFELKDDSPPLNVASDGSSRSTSGGGAAVVRCPFER